MTWSVLARLDFYRFCWREILKLYFIKAWWSYWFIFTAKRRIKDAKPGTDKRPTCRPIKNRGWKEEVKPRTDKRPINYEGCLMCICICYVHTDTILDFSHCTLHLWQIPKAVPRGLGLACQEWQDQTRITFTRVHKVITLSYLPFPDPYHT